MKNFKWLLLLTLVPASVRAANYDYECEADADGSEGLCLAEPTDQPIKKKKASNIADTDEAGKAAPADGAKPLIFGADTRETEQAAQAGVSAKARKTNNAAAVNAIRAQEKIRQVETFLQPIKGADGFAGDNSGPAKAGE